MTTSIKLNGLELAMVRASLRLLRAISSENDLADLNSEEIVALGSMNAGEIFNDESGDAIALLDSAEIDDLCNRLKIG